MQRPSAIVCSQKELLRYVFDLECYIEQLECEIRDFNAKRALSDLEVQKMLKNIELLKNKLIENKH